MSGFRAMVLGVLAGATVAFPTVAAANPCVATQTAPLITQDPGTRAAIVCLINAERARAHLPALKVNRSLTAGASAYSARMVAARFFAHIDPRGGTLTSRARASGYIKGAAIWGLGENLAWGAGSRSTPSRVVAEWMASPGHRANILERSWREVGVGVAMGNPVSGTGGATFAVEFGTRRANPTAKR